MIKVKQIKVDVKEDNDITRLTSLLKKANIQKGDIISYEISKQSLDARDKNKILYVYEMIVEIKNEKKYLKNNKNKDITLYNEEKYTFEKSGTIKISNNIVIVGSGPAGLMSAYILSENGYKPIIIERGKCIEKRCRRILE